MPATALAGHAHLDQLAAALAGESLSWDDRFAELIGDYQTRFTPPSLAITSMGAPEEDGVPSRGGDYDRADRAVELRGHHRADGDDHIGFAEHDRRRAGSQPQRLGEDARTKNSTPRPKASRPPARSPTHRVGDGRVDDPTVCGVDATQNESGWRSGSAGRRRSWGTGRHSRLVARGLGEGELFPADRASPRHSEEWRVTSIPPNRCKSRLDPKTTSTPRLAGAYQAHLAESVITTLAAGSRIGVM